MKKFHVALITFISYLISAHPPDLNWSQPNAHSHLTAWESSSGNSCNPDIFYFSKESEVIAAVAQPSKSNIDEWIAKCIDYQRTGDKKRLDQIKTELEQNLSNAWPWQKRAIRDRLQRVEDLLNDPLTAQLFIIKNSSLYQAEAALHAIHTVRSRYGFNPYEAAKTLLEARPDYQKKKQQEEYERSVNHHMRSQQSQLQHLMADYQELIDWQEDTWLSQCLQAYQAATKSPSYTQQSYILSPQAQHALQHAGHNASSYQQLYGNQLQHVIHQHCITVLECTVAVPEESVVYYHQGVLIDCVDAAHEHNQHGFVVDAVRILNFCSAFLDYSAAVLEGAVNGTLNAVQDIVTHPIQTGFCLIAGEYLLAFHLGKLLGDLNGVVTDLLFLDFDGASREWHNYIEPLDAICDKIKKKEFTLRDGIKAASHGAAYLLAQLKLLGGLGKLYEGVKNKAITFMQNNPFATPQQYVATAEGNLLKVLRSEFTQEETKLSSVLKAEMDREKVINPGPSTFSEECIEKAVNLILRDGNKVDHLFKNAKHNHNLEPLVRKLGSKEKVVQEILRSANMKMPISGEFMNLPVELCGFTVYIRGNVVDGIPRLGTMFIRKEDLCHGLKNLKN